MAICETPSGFGFWGLEIGWYALYSTDHMDAYTGFQYNKLGVSSIRCSRNLLFCRPR